MGGVTYCQRCIDNRTGRSISAAITSPSLPRVCILNEADLLGPRRPQRRFCDTKRAHGSRLIHLGYLVFGFPFELPIFSGPFFAGRAR